MAQGQSVLRLFDEPSVDIEGFQYRPDLLTPEEEDALLLVIRTLPFREVVFRGVTAKRRVVQLGYHYSFQSRTIAPAEPIPDVLLPLRARAGALAGVRDDELAEALVTEYQPGAGIGWHRDAPPFGIIVGISLAGSCRLRMRQGIDTGTTVSIELAPRSAYVFAGPARTRWQHSIPPTKSLRYSVTFRTLRMNPQLARQAHGDL